MRAQVSRTLAHRWDDLTWRLPGGLWDARWHPSSEFADRAFRAAPLGFLTPERAEGLRGRSPQEARALVDSARAIMGGRFQFFGYPEVQLGTPLDFAYDPHAAFRWPARHGKRIDYRHIRGGDPKWIWELNRCQQLPLLIQAWLVTEERSYAEAAIRQALRWAVQNPPGRGIAWANGYEAGLRAISLAVSFDALRGSGILTEHEEQQLLEILWQHGRWIQRDPSTHSSANNHRIGELVGVVSLSSLAPELREAEVWLPRALDELAQRAPTLILPDGVGAEMAFTYHLHVVELLLVAVAVLDATTRAVPDPILEALDRSGEAICAQIGGDELPLRYGDSDDAIAIRLSSSELRDARSVAASIASRLHHPRARLAARLPDWTSWWLFGEPGVERIESTEAAPPARSTYLSDGGLAILRRDGLRVTVDVGPLGFRSLAAHGHADALALTVVKTNQELVTDPGVGSYFRDRAAREAFRSTAFHGTVEVDGRSQSEPGGAFLWSKHANVIARSVDLDQGLVFAEHDGYQRLSDPVRHRRAVCLLERGELLVCDLLNANGAHTYRQHWPLPPGLEPTVVREQGAAYHAGVLVWSGNQVHMRLSLAAGAPGQLTLAWGERDPMRGWWSERLESFVPAYMCSWGVDAPGDVALAAVVSTRPESAESPIAVAGDRPIGVAVEGSSVLLTRWNDDDELIWRINFDTRTLVRAK